MDLLGIIIRAIVKIMTVFLTVSAAGLDVAEGGLRAPLDQIGVKGILQTLLVATVPVLSLMAAIHMLRGFIRAGVVVALVMICGHALWPLIGDIERIPWATLNPS